MRNLGLGEAVFTHDAAITLIGRERDGRITGLTRAGTVTWCGYDDGGHPCGSSPPLVRGFMPTTSPVN